MKSIQFAISGALLALTAVHAAAAPSANTGASITNVVMGVIDLTPADGVAAWYQSSFTSNYARATVSSSTVAQNVAQTVATPEPVNALLNYGATRSSGHADVLGGLNAQAINSDALGPDVYVYGGAEQHYTITVGAHSMLTVSGLASTWADKSADAGRLFEANSWAIVYVNDRRTGGSTYHSASRFSQTGTVDPDQIDKPFWLAFANVGDTETTVYLSMEAHGASTAFAAPVPEPSTYAMLAAGLLLTGLAARRRKLRNPD